MTRIPYPSLDPNATGAGPQGQILNIQKMTKHLPEAIDRAFGTFSGSILWRGALPADLRELIIVRVGNLSKSIYELHHHEAFARHVGVSEAKLEGLRKIDTASGPFSPLEHAVLVFVDEVVKNVRPSDAALEGLQKHMPIGQILEVVAAVGCYMLVCRLLETTGVQPDPVTIGFTPPSPPART